MLITLEQHYKQNAPEISAMPVPTYIREVSQLTRVLFIFRETIFLIIIWMKYIAPLLKQPEPSFT